MALKTKWDSKVFLRIRDLWDTQRRIAVKKLRATEADPGHQKRGRENGVQQGGAEERQHLRKSSEPCPVTSGLQTRQGKVSPTHT